MMNDEGGGWRMAGAAWRRPWRGSTGSTTDRGRLPKARRVKLAHDDCEVHGTDDAESGHRPRHPSSADKELELG